MKRFFGIFSVICLFFSFAVYAVPAPTKEFYCNDFAGVLSPATENDIIQRAGQLEKQNGVQVVVATVREMGGKDIEGYALNTKSGRKGKTTAFSFCWQKKNGRSALKWAMAWKAFCPIPKQAG